MKSRILFLITCSNNKASGGVSQYRTDTAILNYLGNDEKSALVDSRKRVFNLIRNGGFSRQGKELRELPYNRHLQEGPDFSGREEAVYLPATERYLGRLYREISPETWKNRRNHVLILSGLYGLVFPEEDIQRYSLHLKDSRNIQDVWEVDLTLSLESYARQLGADTIVDCTGENLYRKTIDWQDLRSEGFSVFHVFAEQNAGPDTLMAIGSFLQEHGLVLADQEMIDIMETRGEVKTPFDKLHFIRNAEGAESLGLPVEEPYDFQKKEDEIVPVAERPIDFRDGEGLSGVEIIFTYRVNEQMNGLDKNTSRRVHKALGLYITNPRHPSLGTEKLEKNGETFYRIRADQEHRIHLQPWDNSRKQLVIRAVGGHRLERIG